MLAGGVRRSAGRGDSTVDERVIAERFPRSSRYHADWVLAGVSGAANALWMAEWIAGAGLVREIDGPVPEHLRDWWTPDLWCLHSADWWKRHWARTGILDVERADTMPNGWRLWMDWHRVIAPDNAAEIRAIEADAG